MYRRFIATGFALLLLVVCVGSVSAQTGYIAAYYDNGFSIESANCPGDSTISTMYIAAVNWNMYVNGVQFKVNYPSGIEWILDFGYGTDIVLGTTPTGMARSWSLPQNGYQPLLVCKVAFRWLCPLGCGSIPDQSVEVVGHPLLGNTVAATRWPDNALIQGVGLTATACPMTIPTENTTWGKLKAVFSD